MTFWDWMIFFLPLAAVMVIGVYCRRYVKSVVDFLAAGRVAGRYMLIVSSVTDGTMGVIILVGAIEVFYKTGFAIRFWNNIYLPLSLILGLAGFVTYRYREMKVLSFGQYLEMRYSRSLRIFAALLRVTAEIMASMLAPALAARLFIYLFKFPASFMLFGLELDTYITIIVIVITLAMILILCGGVLGLMVTDCIQGLILYPCLAIMVIFICSRFSWFQEMVPVMMDRVPGESFLNPYDIENLRDFNLFNFGVVILGIFIHGASWAGGGSASAAKSAHEQKMAGVLGRWAGGLFGMFSCLLAIMIVTYLNHEHFAGGAKVVRDSISTEIVREIVPNTSFHKKFDQALSAIPEQKHIIGKDKPLSQKVNLDTAYLHAVEKVMDENKIPKSKVQEFTALYHQLMTPVTLRHLLPPGLLGMFAMMMVLMMLSTDDTRIYCSGTTIAQDIILPLLKKPPTPQQHLKLIRWCCVFVGVCFFVGSVFMRQMDYINLFIAIVCSIWMGGCGPVMVGGMYCSFGNTVGAYCSLISGMFISLGGILAQRNWADIIYPWLEKNNWVEPAGNFLSAVSAPFNPIIVWEMNPKKFPINSIEIYALAMLISLSLYIIGSALTYKGAFNMDKMLHRGIYNVDNEAKPKTVWNIRTIVGNMIGITPCYTKFDRFLAWFTFYYSILFSFFICFVVVLCWNTVSPWSIKEWGWYFFLTTIIVPGVLAIPSTFLFTIGGTKDIIRLFRDLKNRKTTDASDNGMVTDSETTQK